MDDSLESAVSAAGYVRYLQITSKLLAGGWRPVDVMGLDERRVRVREQNGTQLSLRGRLPYPHRHVLARTRTAWVAAPVGGRRVALRLPLLLYPIVLRARTASSADGWVRFRLAGRDPAGAAAADSVAMSWARMLMLSVVLPSAGLPDRGCSRGRYRHGPARADAEGRRRCGSRRGGRFDGRCPWGSVALAEVLAARAPASRRTELCGSPADRDRRAGPSRSGFRAIRSSESCCLSDATTRSPETNSRH